MLTLYVTKTSDAREAIELLDGSGRQWRQVTLSMGSESERQKWQSLKEAHQWSTLPMIVEGERTIGGLREARAFLSNDSGQAAGLATVLGLGGLIPFVATAACLIGDIPMPWFAAERALLAYAATIFSFVGALQWGLALTGCGRQRLRYALSVVPSLAAWLLLITPLPFATSSLAFAISFAMWFGIERLIGWQTYPAWFRRLRRLLTIVVSATLATVGVLA